MVCTGDYTRPKREIEKREIAFATFVTFSDQCSELLELSSRFLSYFYIGFIYMYYLL